MISPTLLWQLPVVNSFLLVLFSVLQLWYAGTLSDGTLSYFPTHTVGTLSLGTLPCFPTRTVGTLSVGTFSCWDSFLFSNLDCWYSFCCYSFCWHSFCSDFICWYSFPVGTLSILNLSITPWIWCKPSTIDSSENAGHVAYTPSGIAFFLAMVLHGKPITVFSWSFLRPYRLSSTKTKLRALLHDDYRYQKNIWNVIIQISSSSTKIWTLIPSVPIYFLGISRHHEVKPRA